MRRTGRSQVAVRRAVEAAAERVARRGHRFGDLAWAIDLIGPSHAVRIHVDRGVLQGCADSSSADADLVLQTQSNSILPVTPSGVSAFDAAAAWQVGSGDVPLHRIPPVDLCDLRWANDLPRYPGVTASWTSTALGTPFGEVSTTYQVVDGRPVEVTGGASAHTDAQFKAQVRRLVAARAGRIPITEVVAHGGDVQGDLDVVIMIAGLLETPAWITGRLLAPEVADVLDLFFVVADTGIFYDLADATGRQP